MEEASASVSSEAVAALTELLRGLLPEMWRHDVAASRYPDGFALRCHDAEGRPHIFEVRRGQGTALAYSYTLPDAALAAPDRVEAYQAVLAAFTAREADLVAALDAIDAIDAKGTSPELAALLAALLPPSWRNRVVATLTPGGFALRFEDADGRAHTLTARQRHHNEPALVEGQALSYGYTLLDPALDEAAVAPAYRAALEAFAAREGNITPWLTEETSAPAGEGLEAFSSERPAPAGLVELLTATLPEAWRHSLSVTLIEEGFVLRFEDATGSRHILEARRGDESPTLVKGQGLGFSYRAVDDASDEVTLVAAYRAAATAFLAREDELLAWLTWKPAPENEGLATGTFEVFSNESPAPAGLVELLTAALPEAWRHGLSVALIEEGFVLRFEDAAGRKHILEARRGDENPALVKGKSLGFSYRAVDDASDEVSLVAAYRTAATAFLAREDELLAWLTWEPAPENKGLATGTFEVFPDERPAPAALAALLAAALPEGWRSDLSVALTPQGFVLRFADAEGRRHILEARRGDESPALVKGHTLGFSYRAVDNGCDEVTLVAAYSAAMTDLLEREDDLLACMGDEREEVGTPAPREVSAFIVQLLPTEWRRDVEVFADPDGLTIRSLGDDGLTHLVEVRKLTPGATPAVRGEAYGYDYVPDPAQPAEAVEGARRALLRSLAAHERNLVTLLTQTTHEARWSELYPDGEASPSKLRDAVTALLPEASREGATMLKIPDGFSVRFRDARGTEHMLEGRALSTGLPSLVRGRTLGFSYMKVDPAFDEVSAVRWYREIMHGFLANEDSLAAAIASP